MATINFFKDGVQFESEAGNNITPILKTVEVDWAKVLAAKGSALAATDVIPVIRVPAGTVVMGAGVYVKTAANSTTLTLHVGNTANPDEWAASTDGKTVAYGADLNPGTNWKTIAAAGTIDLTLATLTGTLSTGVVQVYALLLDVHDRRFKPGLAALKS